MRDFKVDLPKQWFVSDSPPSTDSGFTTLPITPELRDTLRVAKAESGQSYDDYLREHLSLSVE